MVRWLPYICYIGKMVANYFACTCNLCVQVQIIRASYIRQRIWRFTEVDDYYHPPDFSNLSSLLDSLHKTSGWFEHLASRSDTFSVLCNGMCYLY
jgi:hypothetical protein